MHGCLKENRQSVQVAGELQMSGLPLFWVTSNLNAVLHGGLEILSPRRARRSQRKSKKANEKASFLNWEIILVATEQRWEVRTSLDNYKISSLWLDIIDDYTVANSRPASLHLWDISFFAPLPSHESQPSVRHHSWDRREPDRNAFGDLYYVG